MQEQGKINNNQISAHNYLYEMVKDANKAAAVYFRVIDSLASQLELLLAKQTENMMEIEKLKSELKEKK